MVVVTLWCLYLRPDHWLTAAQPMATNYLRPDPSVVQPRMTNKTGTSKPQVIPAPADPVTKAASQLIHGEIKPVTAAQNSTKTQRPPLPFKGAIINSKYRTGSTYTSEFFNQHADMYFLYEPLGLVTLYEQLFDPIKVIKMAMECDIPGLQKITPEEHWDWISFQLICALNQSPGCPFPKYPFAVGEETCRKAKYKATKLIRVEQIEILEPMMYEGYKLVYILRDPRGMMNSRKDLHENLRSGEQGFVDMYMEARQYCANALMDFLYIANKVQAGDTVFQDQLLIIRYEDLAQYPMEGVKQIYDFLGIPADENVRKWAYDQEMRIAGNVTLKKKEWQDPFNTDRDNPAKVAERWRGKSGLYWQKVRLIQLACREFMSVTGYLDVPSEEAMTMVHKYPSNKPFDRKLIDNYSIGPWKVRVFSRRSKAKVSDVRRTRS